MADMVDVPVRWLGSECKLMESMKAGKSFRQVFAFIQLFLIYTWTTQITNGDNFHVVRLYNNNHQTVSQYHSYKQRSYVQHQHKTGGNVNNPVSYTHLDVYKRQILGDPVEYTHNIQFLQYICVSSTIMESIPCRMPCLLYTSRCV